MQIRRSTPEQLKQTVSVSLAPGRPPQSLSFQAALSRAHELSIALKQPQAALHIAMQLNRLAPAALEPRVAAAEAWAMLGEVPRALDILDRLLAHEPLESGALTARARCLILLNRLPEAADALDAALAQMEKGRARAPYHVLLGTLWRDLGETRSARREFERAARADPELVDPYLEGLGLLEMDDASQARFAGLAEAAGTPDYVRARIAYVLAAEARRREDLQSEFRWLHQANGWKKKLEPFDLEGEQQELDETRRVFDAALAGRAPPVVDELPRPIFIVGMPRSGSTLVEQILGNHSRVGATGESYALDRAVSREVQGKMAGRSVPRALAELDEPALARIRQQYFELSRSVTDAEIFTDKQLSNFKYLGFILRCLPQARIVHCRRQPLAICLSCYQHEFRQAPYTNDLEWLARYLLIEKAYMDHWRALYPGRIHELVYEELVAAPETVARSLAAACGLDWQPHMADPSRNRRTVRTVSTLQVQQPVYRTAVDRWRRYAEFLEPARLILES